RPQRFYMLNTFDQIAGTSPQQKREHSEGYEQVPGDLQPSVIYWRRALDEAEDT
ncbi:hypothetical protein BaRGS_00034785, partial [Batillaria attramentaria]